MLISYLVQVDIAASGHLRWKTSRSAFVNRTSLTDAQLMELSAVHSGIQTNLAGADARTG